VEGCCRGNDDQARTLPRHGSQGTHGTGRNPSTTRGRGRSSGCTGQDWERLNHAYEVLGEFRSQRRRAKCKG